MLKSKSMAPWGNLMGYIILPIEVQKSEPLHRLRKIKATLDKKKLSHEALLSYINGWTISATTGTAVLHLSIFNLFYSPQTFMN